MKTIETLSEISDGRYYAYTDVVKADAGGCAGCHACCVDVGDLVALTPYDVHEMMYATQKPFEALLADHIALRFEGKLQLPYLKMRAPDAACSFLNAENRCQIHAHRPNICRLFPLGRVYEDDDFNYILQVNACTKPKLEKVKIKKWLSIDSYAENKTFLLEWHRVTSAAAFRIKFIRDPEACAHFNHTILYGFYNLPMPDPSQTPHAVHRIFYQHFNANLSENKNRLGIL